LGASEALGIGLTGDVQPGGTEPPVTPRDGVLGHVQDGGDVTERGPSVELERVQQLSVEVTQGWGGAGICHVILILCR
jgi:hypothetical protein